ncbi:MAG TPA: beta-1-3, beta-1-6-glucan biosynthesis protein [Xanthobacteraceae bacterium]|jgi:hypothetical protein
MHFRGLRFLAAAASTAVVIFLGHAGSAQTPEPKPGAQRQQPEGGPQRQQPEGEAPKKIDEYAEAAKVLGGPAANPECMWFGRRAISLLWNDDLDTAFRHLELYERFGCPPEHIQVTFRCVVRQGKLDPKSGEALSARVHACWINPALEPSAAAASVPPTTTNR